MNPTKGKQLLIFFMMFFPGFSLLAQQTPDGASLLPDIDPQHIEIRGDYVARFTGLSRQPILGFAPRPGIFRVDPERIPFMESDDEIVAAIPLSDLEPALKPEIRFIRFTDQKQLHARAGFGTFQSPELRIIAESPLRAGESLAMEIGHLSSSGHRDYSSFSDFNGEVQWTRRMDRSRWGGGIRGVSRSNYSAIPVAPHDTLLTPAQRLNPDITDPVPQKITHHAFGAEARWERLEHAFRGWQSSLALQYFQNSGTLFGPWPDETRETRYRLYVNRFWEGVMLEQVFRTQARIAGSSYNTMEEDSRHWLTNNFSANYHQLFGYEHSVEVWLRFYHLYDPVNGADLYLYPDVQYKYDGRNMFFGEIRIRGFVMDPSLEQLQLRNRLMLQTGRDLEHERGLHIRLFAGVKPFQNIEMYTGLDYWQYYNKGYFMRSRDPGNFYYSYRYTDEVIRLEWLSGIAHMLPRWGITTTLELVMNYSSVQEQVIPTGEIPYLPGWQSSLHVLAEPRPWLDFSVWLQMSGKKGTGIEEDSLDGFVLAGSRADIRLHRNFGMYVKLQNILNQDYVQWYNYEEMPFQAFGGITLQW